MNTEERGETMNDVVALINELRSEERDYLNNYLANAPKWLLEAFQIVRLKREPRSSMKTPMWTLYTFW